MKIISFAPLCPIMVSVVISITQAKSDQAKQPEKKYRVPCIVNDCQTVASEKKIAPEINSTTDCKLAGNNVHIFVVGTLIHSWCSDLCHSVELSSGDKGYHLDY